MASQNLEWCKGRALEYLDSGNVAGALASFVSDLGKNDDTAEVLRSRAFAPLLAIGQRAAVDGDERAMRDWIGGF